jgi:hypothetical protein
MSEADKVRSNKEQSGVALQLSMCCNETRWKHIRSEYEEDCLIVAIGINV